MRPSLTGVFAAPTHTLTTALTLTLHAHTLLRDAHLHPLSACCSHVSVCHTLQVCWRCSLQLTPGGSGTPSSAVTQQQHRTQILPAACCCTTTTPAHCLGPMLLVQPQQRLVARLCLQLLLVLHPALRAAITTTAATTSRHTTSSSSMRATLLVVVQVRRVVWLAEVKATPACVLHVTCLAHTDTQTSVAAAVTYVRCCRPCCCCGRFIPRQCADRQAATRTGSS